MTARTTKRDMQASTDQCIEANDILWTYGPHPGRARFVQVSSAIYAMRRKVTYWNTIELAS